MSHQAYMRGNKVIKEQIARDFGIERKVIRSQMTRAEILIIEYEQFCRNAQALYADASDPETAKGLLRSQMYCALHSPYNQNKLKIIQTECVDAHNAWVNSDHRESLTHVQVCRRKAMAWKMVMDILSKPYKLPFGVPSPLKKSRNLLSTPSKA